MIKINLSNDQKRKIERVVLDDAKKARTGIYKQLEKDEAKRCLKKYQKLNSILYMNDGSINKSELNKILFSPRKVLLTYIQKIGSFNNSDGEEILKYVFKFDNFSTRRAAAEMLRIINTDVCPYCNRQYIFTVESGKVRAQLDHYYSKKRYPYLALSVFNLIPCCSICNTSKSSLDTIKTPILYPYEDEFGYDIYFDIQEHDIKVFQGASEKFDIVVENPKKIDEYKVENHMEKLHLDELYKKHKPYVKNLLKNKYVNSQERIHELAKTFPQLFKSEEEIKSILCMSPLKKDDWNTRVLSKLTYDIITH